MSDIEIYRQPRTETRSASTWVFAAVPIFEVPPGSPHYGSEHWTEN